jgi:hypothetical protein
LVGGDRVEIAHEGVRVSRSMVFSRLIWHDGLTGICQS